MKPMKKVTVPCLHQMKAEGRKITALTAYDATIAALEDAAGMDIILVGDSAGMVISGDKDTLAITLEEMIFLTKSVSRGVKRALLVADMPFGSFQPSSEIAIGSAIRFMKEGHAEGIKIEGAGPLLESIEKMTAMGIPVMGHLGLTPQSVHAFGGYQLRGVGDKEAKRIQEDALRLQDAGVFSIVLEKIPAELAATVSRSLTIPTIGIASGAACDGQILVCYDMLGLNPYQFKFVRRYLDGAVILREAFSKYIQDIQNGSFPSEEESFHG